MGNLISWLKGEANPNDYVETSRTNPFPVSEPFETIHSGSLNGRVTLSSTPVALKIGASALSGRHTLMVYNDSSFIVYIGFNSDVSANDGFQLSSGMTITFKFDPSQSITLYGMIEVGTTDIFLFEIK